MSGKEIWSVYCQFMTFDDVMTFEYLVIKLQFD